MQAEGLGKNGGSWRNFSWLQTFLASQVNIVHIFGALNTGVYAYIYFTGNDQRQAKEQKKGGS